jgi:4'-phosphopantetheinyl transferase EntD
VAAIGADTSTIGRGERREPMWPAGVTGSISHAAGLAVAVTAPTTHGVAGLGVDIEPAEPLDAELWAHVLTPAERALCEASDDDRGLHATRIFSAKEAAFKAVYPLLGAEVDFVEAHADLDGTGGRVEIPHLDVSASIRQGRVEALVASLAVVTRVDRRRTRESAPRN